MYLRPFFLKLPDWAFRNDVYIIEDDYDSELRYHTAPVPGDISCFCLDPWWAHQLLCMILVHAWILHNCTIWILQENIIL